MGNRPRLTMMQRLLALRTVLAAPVFSCRAPIGATRHLAHLQPSVGSLASSNRHFCSHFIEETAVDQVKRLFEKRFAGQMGQDEWGAMSEDEQRAWFEEQLAAIEHDSDRTPGLIDVDAEWTAISSGTHAPTEAGGYRALVEAAVAAEKPDLALQFATHLLASNLGADTPIDAWNVMLYLMPGDQALQLLEILAAGHSANPDTHSFTAVISTLGDEGRIEQAIQLMERMKHAGHAPNGMTYNSLILDACHYGQLEEAVATLSSMEADGMLPLAETLEEMIALAAHIGDSAAEDEQTKKLEALRRSKQEILDTDPEQLEGQPK